MIKFLAIWSLYFNFLCPLEIFQNSCYKELGVGVASREREEGLGEFDCSARKLSSCMDSVIGNSQLCI